MDLLTNFNLHELIHAIGWTLIHSLWQAIAIGAVIWLLFRFISKDNARIRYALSGLGLILISLASAITFYRYIPTNTSIAVSDFTAQLQTINYVQQEETFFAKLWTQLQDQLENIFPYLVQIWMIGILFLSINLILKYIHTLKFKKQQSYPLRSEYKLIADRLIQKFNFKQNILFKESGLLDIPSVIGYFKPMVLLPVSLISGIPENQLEIIIAHELAHIRRHDYLLQFIQGIIELIFFYHPIVWWLSSVVNTERENICDDLAVTICGESLPLIKALNNMEAIRKKQYEMVLQFSGKKGIVLNRIQRILRSKVSTNPKRERFMLSGVFTLLFAGLFLISNFAISENTDSQKAFFSKITNNSTDQRIDPAVNFTLADTTNSPLYILDGIKISAEAASKVDPNDIISMNVLKGKEAITKYGESAQNGAIEIISKAHQSENNDETAVVGYGHWKNSASIETQISDTGKKENTVFTIGTSDKEPLIILDGKEITRAQMDQISPNDIASINVLKDESSIANYGKEGENGVIEIISKAHHSENTDETVAVGYGHWKNSAAIETQISDTGKKENTVFAIGTSDKEPLIILDGKKITRAQMDQISPNDIASIRVLKDESSIENYGKEGENGVIEIISKAQNLNSKPIVKIKGSTKNAPLYIVDGKKISAKKAAKINPDDIESMEVLKDEFAIEKYGKKGKNGVVIIKLKTDITFQASKVIWKGDDNLPMFIKDGKELSKKEFDAILLSQLKEVRMINNQSVINIYGKKAKNGIALLDSNPSNDTIICYAALNPIFIVDGKKVSKKYFESISPEDMQNLTLTTDKNGNGKYGEEGKGGVYEISLKNKSE
jgi:beta-lactamase regulating signal transducer with metallopeptidase domain